MNSIGHANFEVVPHALQRGPLRFLLYTASYHSLHHTKYKFNFCLFCPLWDFLGGTVHPTSGSLHRHVLCQPTRNLDVVFLGHGHYLHTMLHLPWISPYLSSSEHRLRWWMKPLSPLLLLWTVTCRYLLSTSVVQRYRYRETQCATWCLPVTAHFYLMKSHHQAIRQMIITAIKDADAMGVRYLGLAALNKAEWINHGGSDLLPLLKGRQIRIVHGNTLTAAAIHQTVLQHTKKEDEIFITGPTAKIGRALCLLLARRGHRIKMHTASEERFQAIRKEAGDVGGRLERCATYAEGADCGVWLIGKLVDGKIVQQHAPRGALLIDYAVPHLAPCDVPGCRYINGAALQYAAQDSDLTFCHDVKDTVPACLAAAIIHARERIESHEIGEIDISEVPRWWSLADKHGFRLAAATTADDAARGSRAE